MPGLCEWALFIPYLRASAVSSIFPWISVYREWTAGWWWWASLPCVCQWRCWEPCDPDHPSTQAHCNLTPASLPPSSPLPTLTGPNDLTQTPVCLSWRCFYFFLSPASPPPASLSSFLSLCQFDSLSDAKGGELAKKLRERKS